MTGFAVSTEGVGLDTRLRGRSARVASGSRPATFCHGPRSLRRVCAVAASS